MHAPGVIRYRAPPVDAGGAGYGRCLSMRALLIAAALVLTPVAVQAQSRPAPDTPGEVQVPDDVSPLPPTHQADALRMMAVTIGIIGGFVAADVVSGGALTAPLLGEAAEATATVRGAGLRPIIAPPLPAPVATVTTSDFPALRRTLGRALTTPRP